MMLALVSGEAMAQQALPPIEIQTRRAPVEARRGAPASRSSAAAPSTALPPPATSALGVNPGGRMTGYAAVTAPGVLKTDTPLLRTPNAVQVVTRQTMDDQQAVTARDAIASQCQRRAGAAEFLRRLCACAAFRRSANTYKNGLQEYRSRYLDTTICNRSKC